MTDKSKLIEKIKAILAKSEEHGASENEAMAAIARAQKMMEDHGITMEEIETSTASDFVFGQVGDPNGKRLNYIDLWCTKSIAKFTGTEAFSNGVESYRRGRKQTKKRAVFFGYRLDVEYAQLIRDRLVLAAEYEWQKYSKGLPPGVHALKFRKSFYFGFANRIVARLEQYMKQEITETRNALVVRKQEVVRAVLHNAVQLQKGKEAGPVYVYTDPAEAGEKAGNTAQFMTESGTKKRLLLEKSH